MIYNLLLFISFSFGFHSNCLKYLCKTFFLFNEILLAIANQPSKINKKLIISFYRSGLICTINSSSIPKRERTECTLDPCSCL